jgi:hypothetical protein
MMPFALRSLALGEILDRAVTLFVRHFAVSGARLASARAG